MGILGRVPADVLIGGARIWFGGLRAHFFCVRVRFIWWGALVVFGGAGCARVVDGICVLFVEFACIAWSGAAHCCRCERIECRRVVSSGARIIQVRAISLLGCRGIVGKCACIGGGLRA